MRAKSGFTLIAIILAMSISPAHGQDFAMRVVTDQRHDWTKVSSLKIIAEPGKLDYREIILTNGSNRAINLSLKLANSTTTDGVIRIDDSSEANSSPYIKFSENPVSLGPRAVKTIRISLKTPLNINPFTESPYLTLSTQPKVQTPQSDGQIRAVLPIVNRVAYPVFIGVGNYRDFETKFTIEKIEFRGSPEGNFAQLWVKNEGKLDLPIKGSIRFQDATFAGPIFGPYEFENSAVLPNSSAFVPIPLPADITETQWRIFSQVESNDIIKTKVFVEDVSFSNFSILNFLMLALIFVFSLLLFVWSFRQLRHRSPVKTRSSLSSLKGLLQRALKRQFPLLLKRLLPIHGKKAPYPGIEAFEVPPSLELPPKRAKATQRPPKRAKVTQRPPKRAKATQRPGKSAKKSKSPSQGRPPGLKLSSPAKTAVSGKATTKKRNPGKSKAPARASDSND